MNIINKQNFLESVDKIKHTRCIFEFTDKPNVIGNFISTNDNGNSVILSDSCVGNEKGKPPLWFFENKLYDISNLKNCILID